MGPVGGGGGRRRERLAKSLRRPAPGAPSLGCLCLSGRGPGCRSLLRRGRKASRSGPPGPLPGRLCVGAVGGGGGRRRERLAKSLRRPAPGTPSLGCLCWSGRGPGCRSLLRRGRKASRSGPPGPLPRLLGGPVGGGGGRRRERLAKSLRRPAPGAPSLGCVLSVRSGAGVPFAPSARAQGVAKRPPGPPPWSVVRVPLGTGSQAAWLSASRSRSRPQLSVISVMPWNSEDTSTPLRAYHSRTSAGASVTSPRCREMMARAESSTSWL